MQPQCPPGTSLLTSNFVCAYPCDTGTDVFNQDDLYCVAAECPPETTVDSANNSSCLKASTPLQGFGCPPGSTEWIPNLCFLDCPAMYRENGQSCLIPLQIRQVLPPDCPSFYALTGQQCTLSSTFLFILCLCIIFVFVTAYLYVSPRFRRCPRG